MTKLTTMVPIMSALAGVALNSGVATAQYAPSSSYTSFGVTPGTSVQLGYYASMNNNCTPAHPPTIRVIEAPKFGTLTVRPGELTTDKIAGCPSLRAPAQIVFYEARSGGADTDVLIYEVTSANGQVETFQITIRIEEDHRPGARQGRKQRI